MTDTSLDVAFSIIAQRAIPGATLLQHRPLEGGVSAAVYALEVSAPGGPTALVVRRHGAAAWKQRADDVTEKEFQLLSVLQDLGVPVPRPLLLDVSARLLPSPFFVMELVKGSTHLPEAFLGSALRQMAEFLARLHSIDVQTLRLPQLALREDPARGALDYLPDSAEAAPLRAVISAYSVHPFRPSLVHGDYWPGNILWDNGRLAAVLDWEDAAIGPPASDVACCRAELNALFDESAARAFTEHYLSASASTLHDLALWDTYVGSAALATLHDWGLPPAVEARRRERTASFVAEAADALLRTCASARSRRYRPPAR